MGKLVGGNGRDGDGEKVGGKSGRKRHSNQYFLDRRENGRVYRENWSIVMRIGRMSS